jgi:hypothetical protein
MPTHNHLDALYRAMSAELLQWSGPESGMTSRRHTRTVAALVLGASTVVGATDQLRAVAPATTRATAEIADAGLSNPTAVRPALDRLNTIDRVLAHAQASTERGTYPARAVATLALEIGRLQRDLGVRSPDGMEECVGEAYAALEAVRRAVADVVVDEEDPAVASVVLDRAAQLLA